MRFRIAAIAMAASFLESCSGTPVPREGAGAPPGAPASGEERGLDLEAPVPESFRLENGLTVWLLRTEAVPLSTLGLVVPGGSSLDPLGREGLAAMTATMLDEGAGSRGALEIAEEVDYLGAQIGIDVEREFAHLSLEVLEKNLDAALAILADIVARPAFLPAEWERVKTLCVNDLIQRREEPREVSRVAADRAFYGEGHPFAHPVDGYEASVRRIELADVKELYAAWFRPERATIVFAGKLSAEELRERLGKAFGMWRAGPAPPAAPRPAAPPSAAHRWVLVDKPGAPQTEIRVLVPAPAQGDPAVAPITLANLAFGGTFTSRLMSNLRERQKLTYGASSGYAPRLSAGHLSAASAVHAEGTLTALVEFCREFRLMRAGELSADELRKVRTSHASRVLEALETQAGAIEIYLESAARGFPPSERREFFRALGATPREAVASAASGTFRWDRATVVLVGDRKAIEAQLADPSAAGALRDVAGEPLAIPPLEVRGREGEAP